MSTLRVVCLAEQYPGPYATLPMSDLGAEVILVERPAGGDPSGALINNVPALGEHTRQVLAAAGMTPAQIEELFDRGSAAEPSGEVPAPEVAGEVR